MKKYLKIIVIILLLAILGCCCVYIFKNQAIGRFKSDLIFHIKYSLDNQGSYSIISIIYVFLYKTLGIKSISIFLSVVELSSIYMTKIILKKYIPNANNFELWLYAIALNILTAIHIPLIFNNWYLGVQTPNPWHNSTYICMKPIGLFVIYMYQIIEENYLNIISWKKYIIFVISLVLVNSIKPNFIVAFAPTMLVFLIIDFFKYVKKDPKKIIKMIIFGTAVLISLPILYYQNKVLFGQNTSSELKIGFALFLTHYNPKFPIISLIQSAAFPLFVIRTNLKEIKKNKQYLFNVILYLFSFLIFIFIEESGPRVYSGNLAWTYYFGLMVLFITALSIIINQIKSKKKPHNKYYYIFCYLLLSLHVICGIIYFARILLGYNFI